MRDLASRPEDSTSFVGRTAEIGELRELLRAARAVTLCGAGGIGKTRLASRLLSEVTSDFPDGAWFAELGELRRPDDLVPTVASVIAVDEEPGRPLVETLSDALRDRTAILVLDNCEHLIEACAALSQRLLASAPGLRILATSREPLRIAAEAAWQVPPLTVPPDGTSGGSRVPDYDAIMLFAERARAVMPGFSLGPANLGRVAAICRALDGLPLGHRARRGLGAGAVPRPDRGSPRPPDGLADNRRPDRARPPANAPCGVRLELRPAVTA